MKPCSEDQPLNTARKSLDFASRSDSAAFVVWRSRVSRAISHSVLTVPSSSSQVQSSGLCSSLWLPLSSTSHCWGKNWRLSLLFEELLLDCSQMRQSEFRNTPRFWASYSQLTHLHSLWNVSTRAMDSYYVDSWSQTIQIEAHQSSKICQ